MPTPERAAQVRRCGCTASRGDIMDLAQMIHLYRCQLWSTYRIAAAAGISRQRLTRLLRGAGVSLRVRGAGGTKADRRATEPDNLTELLQTWYVDSRMSSVQIAAKLGMSERTVRLRLAEYGIARRSRGQFNREDRTPLDRDLLDRLYTEAGLPAREVAARTATSTGIVLRNAHDLGIPVRVGGPRPRGGPSKIALIDALYADPLVAAVVARHHVPIRAEGGQLWQRFPDRVPLTHELLSDLYGEAGVAVQHIEMLTGHPAVTILRVLRANATAMRPPGGRSPFLRRWRERQRVGARGSSARGASGSSRRRKPQRLRTA